MPIQVMAMGRVTGAPSQVSTDHGELVMFVFDPFPEEAPADAVHGCEVHCRDSRLIHDVLLHGVVGADVALEGRLTMSRLGGPVEDDLCAVRVSIEVEDLFFGTPREVGS